MVNAVNLAVARRQPKVGVIHHSVRGSQYTSLRFTQHLQHRGLVGSMGRVGSPGDNAMMEAFFLEITYNRERRHSSLNYRTPTEFNTEARAKLTDVH